MDFNIYLIGDKNLFETENAYLDAVDKCLSCGIKAIQLRQKDIGIKEFIALGEKIKSIADKYDNVKLFVNDRIDVALALGAYGVHLNKNSVPVRAVREKSRNLKLFYSSHSVEEAISAQNEGADAVTFSPIFKTKDKYLTQGLDLLKKAVNSVNIPVFALGGINKSNIVQIRDAGAQYIAVQSGILTEKNICDAVRFLFHGITA